MRAIDMLTQGDAETPGRADMRKLHSASLSLCRSVTPPLCAIVLVVFTAAPAFAQTTVVQPERIPYVELFVTFALCGAAVFAVCRSSRRN